MGKIVSRTIKIDNEIYAIAKGLAALKRMELFKYIEQAIKEKNEKEKR